MRVLIEQSPPLDYNVAFSFGDERIVEGNASIDHDLFHLCGFEDWPSHTPGIMADPVDPHPEEPSSGCGCSIVS